MLSYFLHETIFCLGIYVSISKQSKYFWKWVISTKLINKLLIYNISLIGHRKSACSLRPLAFLITWVIALFWHWRSQAFLKGCCHHVLKTFCEARYNRVLKKIVWHVSKDDLNQILLNQTQTKLYFSKFP